jgi:oligopeptide transport system ATP-binding protein
MTDALIEIAGLVKTFRTAGTPVHALRGVDLRLERGEIVGVVGESGSGKSTLGDLVLGIGRPTAGTIRLGGAPIPPRRPKAMRRRIQLVAQNPLQALNPKRTILQSLALPLAVHHVVPRSARRHRAAELLDMVGLSEAMLDRTPHTLSGGQRQRVALARAIAAGPDLLVLDEPTSALDVSVQARVLDLLVTLQERLALTYLFITHDLGVVRLLAHRVVVMLRGRIVEAGPVASVFSAPRHRYTQMLLSAVPVVTEAEEAAKPAWPWDRDVGADLAAASTGCPFRPRCPYAVAACAESERDLVELAPGHAARCHNPGG